jgi:hypothetical protein
VGAVKKTISINEKVAKEAYAISRNFSSIVEMALIFYLQHHHVKKAMQSFGKWEKRTESSVDIVDNLRYEDNHYPITQVTQNEVYKTKCKRGK